MLAGLYAKTMFSFVRNYQTIFQCDYTCWHSHQQWMRVPIALFPHQQLVVSVFSVLKKFNYYDRCVVVNYIFILKNMMEDRSFCNAEELIKSNDTVQRH